MYVGMCLDTQMKCNTSFGLRLNQMYGDKERATVIKRQDAPEGYSCYRIFEPGYPNKVVTVSDRTRNVTKAVEYNNYCNERESYFDEKTGRLYKERIYDVEERGAFVAIENEYDDNMYLESRKQFDFDGNVISEEKFDVVA